MPCPNWKMNQIGTNDYHQLVIVCSANSDSENLNLAYAIGVDGFLEKPLHVESFHATYLRLRNETSNVKGVEV